jgi:AraC family transcriptional regulator
MRLERLARPAARLGSVRVPGFVLTLGVHPAGSALPRHAHDDPTICYVLHGGFTEYTRGASADCGAATLRVTPAGEPHWNRFGTGETRGLRIDVDRDRFADVPDLFHVLDEPRHTAGGRGGDLAHRLMRELTAADSAGPIAAEGLALELVVELARSGPLLRRGEPPRWLNAAEDLIRERYRTGASVGEIARVVGVHPATLARAYRRRFGCTVGERIRALRVEHAASALRETSDRLSEIALRAGFYDQSHFTNVFRRHVGVTPGAFRAARQ